MSLPSLDSTHKATRSHMCTICDYTASRKGHLKRHMESVHEGKKPHKCSLCDYTSSQKGHVKLHIESAHGGKTPHKWSICSYIQLFKKRVFQTTHWSSSSEEKNQASAQFVISFLRKGNLKQHIQTVGDRSQKTLETLICISELAKYYQLENKCSIFKFFNSSIISQEYMIDNTGSPPLTRFFGSEKICVKEKSCYRRSILVLKPGNGTFSNHNTMFRISLGIWT